MHKNKEEILARLNQLTHQDLKHYLAEELTNKRLGLAWESDLIERDESLNANFVMSKVDPMLSHLDGQLPMNCI
jgi:adenine-specific DNA-methyltransferase